MTFEPPLYMQNSDDFEYNARQDRFLIETFFAEGLLNAASTGAVTQRAAAANLSVDVAPFDVIITGDDDTRQGAYLIRLVEGENVTVSAPPGSGTRTDLLVVENIDSDVVPLAGRPEGPRLRAIAGTVVTDGSTPPTPDLPPTAVPLATFPVTAGQTAILTYQVTPIRVQSSRVPAYNVNLQDLVDAKWKQYVAAALAEIAPATQTGVDRINAIAASGVTQVRNATNGILDQVNLALSQAARPYSPPTRTTAFLYLS